MWNKCVPGHSGSETSLNMRMLNYETVCEFFFWNSLNFFKNCPRLIFLLIKNPSFQERWNLSRDVASLKVMGAGANFENLPTKIGEGGHVFRFEDPWLRIHNVNILTSIYVEVVGYRSQFWSDFHKIHMVGAGPIMGEPYCFWKQSAQ